MSGHSELRLNPGRPQRRVSGGSFLVRGIVIIAFLWFLSTLWNSGHGLYQLSKFAHEALYQNQTLEQVANRSLVVRPLVDEEQTFDVGVSVWVKRTSKETDQFRAERRIGDLWDQISNVTGAVYGPQDRTNRQWYNFVNEYDSYIALQKPLFSDIISRGLRLKDKDIFFDVNFSVPTAIFRDVPQNSWDLRGSVFLIPNSLSLLDHMSSFSTSRPMKHVVPVRSYPFPLNSTTYKNHTNVDEVLDSIAFSFPLIALLEVPSKCPADSQDSEESEEDITLPDFQDPDYGFLSDEEDVPIKYRGDVLKKHPFIITRTRLLFVDETHIFNRKAFDNAHRKLLQHAADCREVIRQTTSSTAPFWDAAAGSGFGCKRTYREHGNWETRLELEVPTEDGETRKEYAYAPYISTLSLPPAPMDLLRVPVNREKCNSSLTTTDSDQEWMNVTWHLSYTGRSPGKLMFAERFRAWPDNMFHKSTNLSDSEWLGSHEQAKAEFYHGWFGHRFHEDAHPRRKIVLDGILLIADIACWILSVHYWYTRTSTVSLSVTGNAIYAMAGLLYAFAGLRNQWRRLPFVGPRMLLDFVRPILTLKTIFKLELVWNGMIPSINRLSPTHAERASFRLDQKIPLWIRLGIFQGIVLLCYFLEPQNLFWFRTVPIHKADDSNPRVLEAAILSFALAGSLAQLVLNHRSGVFSGRYKLEVLFRVVGYILAPFWEFVPRVSGMLRGREGISLKTLLWAVVYSVSAYQALTLPSMKKVPVEDESEE